MTPDYLVLAVLMILVIRLCAHFRGSPKLAKVVQHGEPCHGIDELLKMRRPRPAGAVAARPTRKLAVVTCMDCRIHVEALLGLGPGEAHILRNAGGIVTEDVLRSLILSHHLLGTEAVLLLHHTECGLLTFEDEALRRHLIRKTGRDAAEPAHFHAFRDLHEDVRQQMRRLREHPWLPATLTVRGFIHDVRTGELTEVSAEPAEDESFVQAPGRRVTVGAAAAVGAEGGGA